MPAQYSSRLNLLKSNAQSWTIYEVTTYCAALNGVVVTSDTGTKWYNPPARTLLSTGVVGHCHHGHSPRTISLPIHLWHFPLPRLLKQKFEKMTLTRTPPDPNRSTSINVVHVNGRSLYTVDRRMVNCGGKWKTSSAPRKKGGELSWRDYLHPLFTL